MNLIVTLTSLMVAMATRAVAQSTTSAPQAMCASYLNRYTQENQCIYSFIVPKKDRDHCPGLEDQVRTLHATVQDLIRRQNDTDLQIRNINKNEENMKNIGRMEAQIRELQDRDARKTKEYNDLIAEKNRLQTSLTESQIRSQNVEAALQDARNQLTPLDRNHSALLNDFSILRHNLTQLTKEHAKLKAAYSALEKNKTCSDVNKHLPSCAMIKEWGYTESGDAMIDPDGEGGVEPFLVYCDMDSDPSTGITVIRNTHSEDTYITGCDEVGCFSQSVDYAGVSTPQIAKLVDISIACEQYVRYKCYDSKLLRDGTGWWVSRNNTRMNYWGGAAPGSNKCACGMTGTCQDPNEVCNCDSDSEDWLEDAGFLRDKDSLPVTGLRFGDIGTGANEKAKYTLGSLRCKWNVNSTVPSCGALQKAGVQRSGNFLVDPDGPSGPLAAQLTHCDLESGTNSSRGVVTNVQRNPNLFVFSDCGQKSGRFGPTQELCNTSYSGSNVFVRVVEGMQMWRVPRSGKYMISAYGPSGFHKVKSLAGHGAVATGQFNFAGGTQMKILVGQKGLFHGGSGGTFVIMMKETYTAVPYVIAGAGGSSTNEANANYEYTDASTVPNAKDGSLTGTNFGHGGKDGNGGERGNTISGTNTPGGGAGFRTGGTPSSDNRFENPKAARAIKGTGSGAEAPGVGGSYLYITKYYDGGFGGGGSGSKSEPGGAGGYSGGGGGSTQGYSGGGGSYIRTEDATAPKIVSNHLGSGRVVIEYLGPAQRL